MANDAEHFFFHIFVGRLGILKVLSSIWNLRANIKEIITLRNYIVTACYVGIDRILNLGILCCLHLVIPQGKCSQYGVVTSTLELIAKGLCVYQRKQNRFNLLFKISNR